MQNFLFFIKGAQKISFRPFVLFLAINLIFMTFTVFLSYMPVFSKDADDKICIVLDPGHGGQDGGASSASKAEKYYNWEIARYCKEFLEKTEKFNVYLTRDSDVYKSLLERALKADSVDADMMLSIHFNSSDASEIKGSEIIVSTIEKYALTDFAGILRQSLSENAGLNMRGRGIFTRPDTGDGTYLYYWSDSYNWDIPGDKSVGPLSDYYGITTWGCKFGIPTVIVEYAYISNAEDLAMADDSRNLKKMAEATAIALEKYYTNHTHSYAKRTTDYPSSCVFGGKSSEKCTVCGHKINVKSLSDSPDENLHCFVKVKTVPSTCIKRGYILYECRYHQNLINKGYYDDNAPACHSKKIYLDYAEHDYKQKKSDNAFYTVYTCNICRDSYTEVSPYIYTQRLFMKTVKNTVGTIFDFFGKVVKKFDILSEKEHITVIKPNTSDYIVIN